MRRGHWASVSQRADGAYKTRIDSCLERAYTKALTIAKNSAHIVCQPLATHLQQTLLHGPQAGKSNTRIGRVPYLPLLIFIHHRHHELFVESIKTLHIHSHWNTVNDTCHSIATMAQIEKDVGSTGYRWLAMLAIDKHWRLADVMLSCVPTSHK